MHYKSVNSLLALAAGALLAAPSLAQVAASSAELEEVVVTAEKVESTVQKTPISMAVLSGDQIESRGVTTLALLTQVEPSVVFNQGQFNGSSITIRGVSTSGAATFGGSAVTVNTDGQYIYNGFNGLLFDVARVEVLKGPQGTLYGLNSTAGAVNIITNAPELNKHSADVAIEGGNYHAHKVEGSVNLPLGDTVAVRLAGSSNRQRGFRAHVGMDASDYNDIDALRASLLWKPTERFTARLTGEFFKEDRGNSAQQGILLSANATTPAGLPPVNFTVESAGVNPRNWPLNFQGYNKGQIKIARWQLSYDFGPATLTYLGGYRNNQGIFFQPAFGTAVQVVDFQRFHQDDATLQHELRLNGLNGHGLKWQVGYFNSTYRTDQFTNIFNGATGLSPPRTVPFLIFIIPDNEARNNSAYAQLTQSVTDKLSITGGARYTKSTQKSLYTGTQSLNVGAYFGSGGANKIYTFAPTVGENRFAKASWRFGVDYQITPASLLYGSYSTSFKDGGFSQFNSYDPELITAYEVGSKNRFRNDSIELNMAVYKYDYKNQQAQQFVLQPNGQAVSTTVNAGASDLKGAEALLRWLPTATDKLSLNLLYTNARYTVFTAAQPIIPLAGATAVNANLSGNRPPQAPTWTVTAGYDHTWNLGSGSVTASLNTRYMTDYYLSIFNLPGDKVKAFMQSDVQLTYAAASGRWDLSGYIRNLEDNDVLNSASFLVGGASQPIYLFGWAPPQTMGVRLALHMDRN